MRRAHIVQIFGTLAGLAMGVSLLVNQQPVRAQAGVLGGAVVPTLQTETLSAEAFERLHRAVAPAGERWLEIPWEIDLKVARERAEREKKPLFMWVMDGHPLGCT